MGPRRRAAAAGLAGLNQQRVDNFFSGSNPSGQQQPLNQQRVDNFFGGSNPSGQQQPLNQQQPTTQQHVMY
jgi:hypothetical protein